MWLFWLVNKLLLRSDRSLCCVNEPQSHLWEEDPSKQIAGEASLFVLHCVINNRLISSGIRLKFSQKNIAKSYEWCQPCICTLIKHAVFNHSECALYRNFITINSNCDTNECNTTNSCMTSKFVLENTSQL